MHPTADPNFEVKQTKRFTQARARLFSRGRRDLHMKGVGMLVVLLRGVNF